MNYNPPSDPYFSDYPTAPPPPSKSDNPPYGKVTIVLLVSLAVLSLILDLFKSGIALACWLGIITTASIIDWTGVKTLVDLLFWPSINGNKRFWLIVAWIFCWPIWYSIYLFRSLRRAFRTKKQIGLRFRPAVRFRPSVRLVLGFVIGFLIFILGLASTYANSTQVTPGGVPVAQATTAQASVTVNNKSVATADPTATSQPTAAPTATSQPDTSSTSVPTSVPTVVPTATPTTNPCPNAVNNNPWCYDFTSGNYITSPPANFCSYFSCVNNFSNGKGYVEECQDNLYSKTGGLSGSCSGHGGDMQTLYSH